LFVDIYVTVLNTIFTLAVDLAEKVFDLNVSELPDIHILLEVPRILSQELG